MDYIFDSKYEIFMFDALQKADMTFEAQKEVSILGQIYRFDFVVYGKYTKLVVECDGEDHTFEHMIAADAVRSMSAFQFGFDDVLRFSNFQIRDYCSECIETIRDRIIELDIALTNSRQPLDFNKILPKKNKKTEIPYRPYTNFFESNQEICNNQPEIIIESDPLKEILSENDFFMLTKLRNLPTDEKKILWHIIKISNARGFLIINDSFIEKDSELLKIKSLKIMNHIGNKYSILVLPNNLNLLSFLKPKT